VAVTPTSRIRDRWVYALTDTTKVQRLAPTGLRDPIPLRGSRRTLHGVPSFQRPNPASRLWHGSTLARRKQCSRPLGTSWDMSLRRVPAISGRSVTAPRPFIRTPERHPVIYLANTRASTSPIGLPLASTSVTQREQCPFYRMQTNHGLHRAIGSPGSGSVASAIIWDSPVHHRNRRQFRTPTSSPTTLTDTFHQRDGTPLLLSQVSNELNEQQLLQRSTKLGPNPNFLRY